ncbi:hypothetical protein V5O48_012497 [Marasmius crinis-equi]|uniref:F-box domain-containing protein n=1 Tax=Marasmius crinis-equi TaxID=585013 RepID=A0ABR3F2N5_9AGAR
MNVPTSTLTALPTDILSRVLTFSFSFDALLSSILTCKVIYEVYKAHPNSVKRNVAENVTGSRSVLKEALRAIRYGASDEDSETEDDEDDPKTDQVGMDKSGITLTNKEITQLVEIAMKYRALEDVFSLRHKNRRFKSTQLTPSESLRFQRALYRIDLYSRMFSGVSYAEEFETQNPEDEEVQERVEKDRKERERFLSAFSTAELREIWTVSQFLTDIFVWAEGDDADTPDNASTTHKLDMALSVGPASIYRCWDEGTVDMLTAELEYWFADGAFDHPLVAGYLRDPLAKLFRERNAKAPFDDSEHWSSVDEARGVDDKCSRCDKRPGFDLWGPSTYEYLHQTTPSLRPGTGLVKLLQGELSRNSTECRYFHFLIGKRPKGESVYEHVVQDLLDCDYKTPEFDDWKKDDWLCTGCLEKFLRENLHLWLQSGKDGLILILTAGEEIPIDCWYGWDCRTQKHADHAKKRNVRIDAWVYE